jgi:hypothetical protein
MVLDVWEFATERYVFVLTPGNVNPKWPHRDSLIWPHLVRVGV